MPIRVRARVYDCRVAVLLLFTERLAVVVAHFQSLWVAFVAMRELGLCVEVISPTGSLLARVVCGAGWLVGWLAGCLSLSRWSSADCRVAVGSLPRRRTDILGQEQNPYYHMYYRCPVPAIVRKFRLPITVVLAILVGAIMIVLTPFWWSVQVVFLQLLLGVLFGEPASCTVFGLLYPVATSRTALLCLTQHFVRATVQKMF